METPPRAWGRQHVYVQILDVVRNTPTGVGKTSNHQIKPIINEKHPHGRGEDPVHHHQTVDRSETPPRAWGRPKSKKDEDMLVGNTPTGVGKTEPGP